MSMTRDEESHYELGDESDSVSECQNPLDQKLQARDSGIAAESNDESTMPSDEQDANCPGELYTPVRRKSSVQIGSLEQTDFLKKQKMLDSQKRNVVIVKDKDLLKSDSAISHSGDKSPHSQTDANSDGSFVAELLTHFERFQSQIDTNDSDSENKGDTAYGSGISENNSSGRGSRTDSASVRHSTEDVEDELDKTDDLVSPIDDVIITESFTKKSAESPYEQVNNPNDNQQLSNCVSENLETCDHSAETTTDSGNIENKNNLNSRVESHLNASEGSSDSVDTSRNSYSDDKKSENLALSISQKIEGLRTKLVDLKKKRYVLDDSTL